MSKVNGLELVVRAGSGVDTIDQQALSQQGVFLANCPGKNSIAVAELVMGLLIAYDRKIPDNVIAIKQGQWDKSRFSKAKGLYG